MKFKLKMMAVAAAMVATAGAANAAIVSDFTTNGTVVLTAFNTVTQAYYYRDLGFLMDSFLPSALTPTSGLTITSAGAANFADASGWNAWLGSQVLTDIRWTVSAVANDAGNRAIFASTNPAETMANGEVVNFVSALSAPPFLGSAIAPVTPLRTSALTCSGCAAPP